METDKINNDITSKTCKLCHQIKSLNEFYTDKKAPDKLQSRCKKCHSLINSKHIMSKYEKRGNQLCICCNRSMKMDNYEVHLLSKTHKMKEFEYNNLNNLNNIVF